MALDAGMAAALVLTGETSANDLQRLSLQDKPNFVLERIDQLLPPEIWQQLGWDEHSGSG
jgi:ribonucleotide monophosphatase NagD (HAD superfamily)